MLVICRHPGLQNALAASVAGTGWDVAPGDPIAAGTVFHFGKTAPSYVSTPAGLKDRLAELATEFAFVGAEDAEPSSGYAADFGQSTSASTSRAGAADEAPPSWRGQPLLPVAEEKHYSLLRTVVEALCHSSNDRPAPVTNKAVVPKGHLAVLAAKVALLSGAPPVELPGGRPVELNYKDMDAHFQKQDLAVAADFLLAASDPGDRLFEAALGLEARALHPPPATWT